jgi:hypothetical protein
MQDDGINAWCVQADCDFSDYVKMAMERIALYPPVAQQIGTPISQISGRPGHPGFDEFKRIAASWGYD